MKRSALLAAMFACGIIAGFAIAQQSRVAQAMTPSPVVGYTLHIDAQKHFGSANPNEVAHHWCKSFPTITECLLFDSDGPNGHIVGVETIVPTAVWKTFSPSERALWHYHRTEIAKVHATLPDLSPAEAKKVVASIMETYGKIFLFWDPMTNKNPTGQPSVTLIH